MTKAFFEKLTHAGQDISIKESVVKNIENILNFGGFLDAGVDGFTSRTTSAIDGIYRNGLQAIVDQSLDNQQQVAQFQRDIVRVLQVYEPRIKTMQVLNIGYVGQRSRCQLNVVLLNESFEQNFVFG